MPPLSQCAHADCMHYTQSPSVVCRQEEQAQAEVQLEIEQLAGRLPAKELQQRSSEKRAQAASRLRSRRQVEEGGSAADGFVADLQDDQFESACGGSFNPLPVENFWAANGWAPPGNACSVVYAVHDGAADEQPARPARRADGVPGRARPADLPQPQKQPPMGSERRALQSAEPPTWKPPLRDLSEVGENELRTHVVGSELSAQVQRLGLAHESHASQAPWEGTCGCASSLPHGCSTLMEAEEPAQTQSQSSPAANVTGGVRKAKMPVWRRQPVPLDRDLMAAQ